MSVGFVYRVVYNLWSGSTLTFVSRKLISVGDQVAVNLML